MMPIAWAMLLALQTSPAMPAAPQANAGTPASPTYRVPPPELREPISYESVQELTIFRARIAGQDAWVLADNGAQRSVIDLGSRISALRVGLETWRARRLSGFEASAGEPVGEEGRPLLPGS